MPVAQFQPKGKVADAFNQTGIIPDFPVAARWDLYTDASDPLFAKAVEILMKK